MEHITLAMLKHTCGIINRTAGKPEEPWTKGDDGRLVANVGCYHLDGAYGGWALVQMDNEQGGISTIIGGFRPKRDLYERMTAYLNGMRAVKTA